MTPSRAVSAPVAALARVPPQPAARVLALQRTVGNAATVRLLARSKRLPYEHQWENPALLETIYPARETMLKKFVTMYREIELGDMTDPAERQKVIAETRAAMQTELDRLKALSEPTKQDQARIKDLENVLKKGAADTEAAWRSAVHWEIHHRADPLSGDALMNEVRRLFGTEAVPDWLEPMVLDYAGMRYKSAHGSYYSPVRLMYFYERERGTWAKARAEEDAAADAAYQQKKAEWDTAAKKTRGKAPKKPKKVKQSAGEKAAIDMAPEDAVARLEQLRDAGEIPDWAWHKIVRLTELRTWYAETGWEDPSVEKPTGGANDAFWSKVLKAWTGKERVGKHGYGITGWRSEIHRRNALVTTRMVCNELSEATQRQRGVELVGGISKNAEQYRQAAAAGGGAYFKQPTGPEDFVPGAGLFWVNKSKWEAKEPDSSNKVRHIPGAEYPMPPPPEYVAEWKEWEKSEAGKTYKKEKKAYEKAKKAWDKQYAKAKTPEAKAKLPPEPVKPVDTQPAYEEPDLLPKNGHVDKNGWRYTVVEGQPITRTNGTETHWLRWQHQATVLKMMGKDRVFTFETTDALEGSGKLGVSGFATRYISKLTVPGVFVGYIPQEGEQVSTPVEDTSAPAADGAGAPSAPATNGNGAAKDPQSLEEMFRLIFSW